MSVSPISLCMAIAAAPVVSFQLEMDLLLILLHILLTKAGSKVGLEPVIAGGLELGAIRRRLEDRSTSLQAVTTASDGTNAVVDTTIQIRLNSRITTRIWQRIRTWCNTALDNGFEYTIA